MAYSAVPLTSTGDWIDAAWINQYIRDNFAAGVPDIITAAGDLVVGSGANAATVLAMGSAYQVLRVNSGGTGLEWGAGGVSTGAHSNSTGHSYSTNSWRDMPNSSNTVTVPATSTIIALAGIVSYGTGTYGFRQFKLNIDGTDQDNFKAVRTYDIGENTTLICGGRKTGVGVGSRTIKIREICPAAGYTVDSLWWLALIIPE